MQIVEWYPGAFQGAGISSTEDSGLGRCEIDLDRNEIFDLSLKCDVMISNGIIFLDVKGDDSVKDSS